MKQLWAPWRLCYIRGEANASENGCIFCVRHIDGEDRQRLILYRGEHVFVLMNRFPYTNGHLMVAPYRHTADPAELTHEEAMEMHSMMVKCRDVLRQRVAAQGFNIGMNLGQIAGAGIADHLHLHIVPRWSGDTNFMPVFAEVRVIPEHLEATYEHLLPSFTGGSR